MKKRKRSKCPDDVLRWYVLTIERLVLELSATRQVECSDIIGALRRAIADLKKQRPAAQKATKGKKKTTKGKKRTRPMEFEMCDLGWEWCDKIRECVPEGECEPDGDPGGDG